MMMFFVNRGWNTFFDSFTLVLSNIGQETLARDRVRKTLKARIWPFLKSLLLSIGKEPEHCDSVEKGMAFLPMFMDKVVLIDTDSLYHKHSIFSNHVIEVLFFIFLENS